MKEIKVRVLSAPTPAQLAFVTGAAKMTMRRGCAADEGDFDLGLLRRLMEMGHHSPLEQADLQVSVEGASRVFLSQITRHRMCSFTSGSQQYQLQGGFSYLLPPFEDEALEEDYRRLMMKCDAVYGRIEAVMGRDWARYALPNSCRNTLLMKANLREWFCVVIPQRTCRRNTPETLKVMSLVLKGAIEAGLEAFVRLSGPACLVSGRCDQGKMSCGRPMSSWEDLL